MSNKHYEKEYHDKFVSTKEVRSFESHFYSPLARDQEETLIFDFLADLQGKSVLFYGSGAHFSLLQKLCQKGANVIAIDISPNTVKIMNNAILSNNLQDHAQALVMDCEALSFKSRAFDIVIARSIIHHLDIDLALNEINRVLKDGSGKFAAIEPLGTNFVINIYRFLTPASRTEDERPLSTHDLKKIKNRFDIRQYKFLYCLTILSYLQRMVFGDRFFSITFNFLHYIDQKILLKIPLAHYLFWDILILATKK